MINNDNTTLALSAIAIMGTQKDRKTGLSSAIQQCTVVAPAEMDAEGKWTGWIFISQDDDCGKFEAPSVSNPAGRLSIQSCSLRKVSDTLEAMRAVYPDATVNEAAAALGSDMAEMEKMQRTMAKMQKAMEEKMAAIAEKSAALLGVNEAS